MSELQRPVVTEEREEKLKCLLGFLYMIGIHYFRPVQKTTEQVSKWH
jgi:hypothetical protein